MYVAPNTAKARCKKLYVHLNVCVPVYASVYMYMSMCMCVCVCACVCVFVHVYECAYMYVCVQIDILLCSGLTIPIISIGGSFCEESVVGADKQWRDREITTNYYNLMYTYMPGLACMLDFSAHCTLTLMAFNGIDIQHYYTINFLLAFRNGIIHTSVGCGIYMYVVFHSQIVVGEASGGDGALVGGGNVYTPFNGP